MLQAVDWLVVVQYLDMFIFVDKAVVKETGMESKKPYLIFAIVMN